jgi:hypothetical protein
MLGMRTLRHITGLGASFVGALVWILYVVGHCTSAKDDVLQPTPSVLSLLSLTATAALISIVFTRNWVIPMFVAIALILPFCYVVAQATLWQGFRQSVVVRLGGALLLPILLIVAGAFLGSRLRSRLLPT